MVSQITAEKILQTRASEEQVIPDHFGAFVRRARKEKGITLKELADRAGVGMSTLQYMETRGNTTIYTASRVLRVLGYELRVVKEERWH